MSEELPQSARDANIGAEADRLISEIERVHGALQDPVKDNIRNNFFCGAAFMFTVLTVVIPEIEEEADCISKIDHMRQQLEEQRNCMQVRLAQKYKDGKGQTI
jgi:hypothetical protein